MKEELSEEMVYIRVDIPVPTFFRDAMLQIDPEFKGLGEKLSEILAEEFARMQAQTGGSDESPNPTRGQGNNRYH